MSSARIFTATLPVVGAIASVSRSSSCPLAGATSIDSGRVAAVL